MDATRIISLQDLQKEFKHENNRTIRIDPRSFARVDFEMLFHEHYDSLQVFNNRSAQGLCIYIFSGYNLIGRAFLSSKPNIINSLLLGRHSENEIFLTKDQSLSLRHLVFLTHPTSEKLSYRVLDLRSRSGFENEAGELCQALIADGHAFIRLNHYHILCFPSNFSTLQHHDSEVAWKELPSQAYISSELESNIPPYSKEAISSIISIPAPQPLTNNSRNTSIATLELFAGESYVIQPLDAIALRSGVLIGRYTRCDTAFQPFLSSNAISRVHCLIIEVENKYYIIDTASTNGTYIEGERIRRYTLLDTTSIHIGDKDAIHTDGLKLIWKLKEKTEQT